MKPVFDVLKTYRDSKADIIQAIERVLESGQYILGTEVLNFEYEFSVATKNRWAVGVGSGTDAITLALMALDQSEIRNQVIVPAFTAYPTIVGVVRAGLKPVAVDVKRDGLIDPKEIKKAITPFTRAILPVHLMGRYCDMDAIMAIAHENKLQVVEDCAQRTFTKIKGDAGAFSFYPTKTLGCFGDGGAVCTQDDKIASRIKMLRDYGQSSKNQFSFPGLNSRLDELQAAILRVKLKNKNFIKKPFYKKSPDRYGEIFNLNEKGKEVLIHYPYIVTEQQAYTGSKTKTRQAKILSETLYTVSRN